jgi:tRNA pseudouridine65 synthase
MMKNDLPLLYRDDHYLVVNKPAGLLVHRSDLDRHETRFALQLARDLAGRHVYPVHRLDRPTSGALLFALSPEAARLAADAFTSGAVRKTYLAVVRGFTEEDALIDYPLRELPDRFEGDGDILSREAVTAFRRLALVELPLPVGNYPTARFSLLEVSPRTGRRHQIRRHLKHVFHPIIGDSTYGDGRHNRLFRDGFRCSRLLLHAVEITLPHPLTGETLTINAPLDGEFAAAIDMLGWKADMPGSCCPLTSPYAQPG